MTETLIIGFVSMVLVFFLVILLGLQMQITSLTQRLSKLDEELGKK